MTLVQDALNHAASLGLGTAAAGGAAQHIYELAQRVRAYTMHVRADIGVQKDACEQAAAMIAASQTESWCSAASDAYNQLVSYRLVTNEKVRDDLVHAAAQTVLAGERIATRLEELAAAVGAAGVAVDTAIGQVAGKDAIERVADVFTDSAVRTAQLALETVLNNPLIAGVERQLSY